MECGLGLTRDLFCLRLLFQDRKNSCPGSHRVLKCCAEACQCGNRAKRGHHRQYRQQESVKPDLSVQIQPACNDGHQDIKAQNKCVRDRKVQSGQAVQLILMPEEGFGLSAKDAHSLLAVIVLDRLIQAADILKHAGREIRRVLPHFFAHIAADPGNDQGHCDAYAEVSRQRQNSQRDMKGTNIDTHDSFHDQRNADRRNRVRVEHFQKFHVRCDQGDQVTLVPSLQFRRAEPSKCAEDAVADKCQY